MRVFLNECTKQNVEFIRLKYHIPKAACTNNEQFSEYGEHKIDWIGYADDLNIAFKDESNININIDVSEIMNPRFLLGIALNMV